MVFTVDGNTFCRKRGNRREVVDGIAYCTSGGLTADRLEERDGRIVSKRKSEQGRTRYKNNNPFKKSEIEKPETGVSDEKKEDGDGMPKPTKQKKVADKPKNGPSRTITTRKTVTVVKKARGRATARKRRALRRRGRFVK